MSVMYILVGIPGSGKSTWTNSFLQKQNEDFVIISSDKILDEYASQEEITYSESFQKYAKQANQEMWNRANYAFKNGINIIWDQTNLTPKSRKGKIKKARENNYDVYAVVFSVDENTLNKRLAHREKYEGKYIPQNVINDMANKMTNPSIDEGIKKVWFN